MVRCVFQANVPFLWLLTSLSTTPLHSLAGSKLGAKVDGPNYSPVFFALLTGALIFAIRCEALCKKARTYFAGGLCFVGLRKLLWTGKPPDGVRA